MRIKNLWRRTADMYISGFREMTIGRSLWVLIIFKAIVLFAVLKVLFFPDLLKSNYSTDAERAGAVREILTDRKP